MLRSGYCEDASKLSRLQWGKTPVFPPLPRTGSGLIITRGLVTIPPGPLTCEMSSQLKLEGGDSRAPTQDAEKNTKRARGSYITPVFVAVYYMNQGKKPEWVALNQQKRLNCTPNLQLYARTHWRQAYRGLLHEKQNFENNNKCVASGGCLLCPLNVLCTGDCMHVTDRLVTAYGGFCSEVVLHLRPTYQKALDN